jgi:hypothetical protein
LSRLASRTAQGHERGELADYPNRNDVLGKSGPPKSSTRNFVRAVASSGMRRDRGVVTSDSNVLPSTATARKRTGITVAHVT